MFVVWPSVLSLNNLKVLEIHKTKVAKAIKYICIHEKIFKKYVRFHFIILPLTLQSSRHGAYAPTSNTAMITMTKSIHGFLSPPFMGMGLRLAALRAPGAPLWKSKGAPLGHGLASPCVFKGIRMAMDMASRGRSRTKNNYTSEKL